jgi:hypothetical protein
MNPSYRISCRDLVRANNGAPNYPAASLDRVHSGMHISATRSAWINEVAVRVSTEFLRDLRPIYWQIAWRYLDGGLQNVPNYPLNR